MTTAYGAQRSRTKRRAQRSYARHRTLLAAAGALLCLGTLAGRPAQGAPPQPRITLLALGDSLTAGYGLPHQDSFVPRLQAALDAAGLNVHVLDGGVSGDTTAGALARLDWALGDDPDAVLVELGGNDGLRGLDPARMEANLDAILDRLAARHLPVLLSGMVAPPNMGPGYGRAFAAAFDRLGHRPGLHYDPFFLAGVAAHPDLTQADHIHPNARGVAVIVPRIMDALRPVIAEARDQKSKGAAR